MNRKNTTTIISVAVFLAAVVAIGLSSSWAQDFFKSSEEKAMEKRRQEITECKNMERPLECLIDIDQRDYEEQQRSMTPAERMQAEEGQKRIQEQWEEIQRLVEEERMRPIPTPAPTLDPNYRDQFQGRIMDGGTEFTNMRYKYVFSSINTWFDRVDGKMFTVTVGSEYYDPFQGGIILGHESEVETYLTPSKTGPVKIVSANGETGIVELVSLAGEWEVYHEDTDTREYVKTPGGTRYTFNLHTMKFQ